MITIELTGMNEAAACGRHIKGRGYSSPLCKMARDLIADGYAAHDIAMIRRDGVLCFAPSPLSYWADRDVSEGDAYSVRMVKHKPFDAECWA